MTIRSVVTRGFGNTVYSATIARVTLRGYGLGSAFVPFTPKPERTTAFEADQRTIDADNLNRTLEASSESRDLTSAEKSVKMEFKEQNRSITNSSSGKRTTSKVAGRSSSFSGKNRRIH
tara:strand:- start:326 stop:682 length:357 start_codon:yes stop_codon:yes gene_type:complete